METKKLVIYPRQRMESGVLRTLRDRPVAIIEMAADANYGEIINGLVNGRGMQAIPFEEAEARGACVDLTTEPQEDPGLALPPGTGNEADTETDTTADTETDTAPEFATSQAALAEAMGVSTSTIGNWAKQDGFPPKTGQGYNIADVKAWREAQGNN